MLEQRTLRERGQAPEGSVLSRIASFFVEGFAVCGASLHPEAAWQAAQHGLATQARPRSQAGPSSVWDLLSGFGARLRRTRAIRRDALLLEAFDDRMLRDIGIERDQIRHALRVGR